MIRKFWPGLLLVLALTVNLHAENIDQIIFGNLFSEVFTHTCTFTDAPTETGAYGQSCRRIGESGSIQFEIGCDATEQNYLTVKLYGGNTVEGRQQLYLYDPVNRLGAYYAGIPETEIMYWDENPGYQNRFVYSTYLIPQSLTNGKTKVTLKLADAQLQIYRVYTHLDEFFVPEGESQGSNPGGGPILPAVSGKTTKEYIIEQAELALDEMMTWQKWGAAWDAEVAAGNFPAWATGATTWDGRGGGAGWTEQEWKEDLYNRLRQGNCDGMKVPMFYGLAYHAQWSKYYHDPDMIARVVKALDWYCIVQGANGAFDNPWSLSWIGGPDRVNGAGCLEGFGVRGPAEAFLLMQNEIDMATLSELIDNDLDHVADITRRNAWIQLFKWSRDHLLADRGHAVNQDIAQIYAAWQHNEALKVLDPAQALDRSTMLEYAYRASGILPHNWYDSVTHWFSYKGVSCEGPGTAAGGYCGGYGEAPLGYTFRYCGEMNDAGLDDQFRLLFSGWSNYCYPANDAEGYANMVREFCINYRPNRHVGQQFPEMPTLPGVIYAAVTLNDPVATRLAQLYVQNNRVFEFDASFAALNVGPSPHFSVNAEGWVRLVDIWDDLTALPATDYRLPHEDGEPDFAWADEEAQAVVVKDNDVKMLMTMNWRRPTTDRSRQGTTPSNVARIHYMTDQMDRIANVAMESPYGMYELYLCEYGNYSIAMNGSSVNTYDVPVPADYPESAVDMISGEVLDLTGPITVGPMSTVVLDIGEPAFCGDENTDFRVSDLNFDCMVDMHDFSLLAASWLWNGDLGDFAVMNGEWDEDGYEY